MKFTLTGRLETHENQLARPNRRALATRETNAAQYGPGGERGGFGDWGDRRVKLVELVGCHIAAHFLAEFFFRHLWLSIPKTP